MGYLTQIEELEERECSFCVIMVFLTESFPADLQIEIKKLNQDYIDQFSKPKFRFDYA
jgi:hypothetical protein